MSKSRDIADSAATINFIDNLTSDAQTQLNTLDTAVDNISVTSGTLTKTFAQNEVATITLSSSITTPVVSVTKEVNQTGVTNNTWDVNSTTENYTRLDSAPATTLDFGVGTLSNTSYASKSFSVASQELTPTGIAFNSDYSKMYIVGENGDSVYQYSLSTAGDVSTASYDSVSFSFTSQETTGMDVIFNPDGTKMYIVGSANDTVYQYTLTTGYDISTASYASKSFSLASQSTKPTGIRFNNDGTKLYATCTTTDAIYQYSLSTAYDISTASYDSVSLSVSAQDTAPEGLEISPDGKSIYVIGRQLADVYRYSLSTAYDLSTASYSSDSIDVTSQETAPLGIAINFATGKMYVVGQTNDTVYQYQMPQLLELGTGSFASADVGKTIEANSGVFILTSTAGAYSQTTAPTSYAQVASGSWEMYAVVYNTTDGDLELSNTIINTFDVSTAVYSQTFDISSQETVPSSIAFSTDGTKMFVLGNTGDDVNEYALSTAFDVSTASFTDAFSVSSQETSPEGLAFSNDGTKMFVVGGVGQDVNEYTLSTGFDVSTATFVDSFSVSGQETDPQGVAFSTDGTKMFIVGFSGDDVNEYTLSTGFDVSTASFVDSFSVSGQETLPADLAFSTDGTKMFVLGASGTDVNEYTLSTGFDVSTATYSQNFSVSAQETSPRGIAFNNDGAKMFIVGTSGDDVNEYNVGTLSTPSDYHAVHTTNSTDSTYWTDINSMTADEAAGDGSIYYAVSTDDRTTWKIADNTDGIRSIVRNNSGTWQYNSNGTYASTTWTNATTNTELNALQEAMEGATSIIGFDVSTAAFVDSFSVSAQEINPRDVAFNTNGTKMFVVGTTGQDVNEYTLSTGFDVSTATYSQNFSVSAQEASPQGIAFNTDGTKMFIIGNSGVEVNEYTLGTGFDVSTATYSQNFSVSAQESTPLGIAFNTDGTKMFVVGSAGDDVNEYTLSTGFDVSTASYSQNFSVASQDTNVQDIAFNSDGTKMFIVGLSGVDVNEYTLSTGFDVSTATFVDSFSVSSEESNPCGISFNTDGTKMFIVGIIGDDVNEYTLGTTSYPNQMNKTQLDAVSDANHFTLGNDLDLAIVFNLTSGTTVPSSDGVSINYDANVLNKGAILGTDYDYDAPAQNKVRITALTGNNLKVRVV